MSLYDRMVLTEAQAEKKKLATLPTEIKSSAMVLGSIGISDLSAYVAYEVTLDGSLVGWVLTNQKKRQGPRGGRGIGTSYWSLPVKLKSTNVKQHVKLKDAVERLGKRAGGTGGHTAAYMAKLKDAVRKGDTAQANRLLGPITNQYRNVGSLRKELANYGMDYSAGKLKLIESVESEEGLYGRMALTEDQDDADARQMRKSVVDVVNAALQKLPPDPSVALRRIAKDVRSGVDEILDGDYDMAVDYGFRTAVHAARKLASAEEYPWKVREAGSQIEKAIMALLKTLDSRRDGRDLSGYLLKKLPRR